MSNFPDPISVLHREQLVTLERQNLQKMLIELQSVLYNLLIMHSSALFALLTKS